METSTRLAQGALPLPRRPGPRTRNAGRRAALWLTLAIVAVGALAGMGAPATAAPAEQPTASITLDPDAGTLSGCEILEVDIRVDDVSDLFGADVRLSFDETLFEVIDQDDGEPGVQLEIGSLLTAPLSVAKNEADNAAGTVWFAATQLYPTPPVSGGGVLATLYFRAKAPGTSALEFTYTKLGGSGGVAIPATSTDGSVEATLPACIGLVPPDSEIDACETVEVEIWIRNIADLYGADVRLTFDPSIVQVVDADSGTAGVQIEVGDLLTPPLFVSRNEADNSAGTIWFAATQLNPTPPVTGSGVLATIEFAGVGSGSTNVEFSYTKLGKTGGVEIPGDAEGGTVTVTAPVPPVMDSIRLNSTTARLSWTASSTPGIAGYNLYRDVDPYFTPSGAPLYTGAALTYDDVGILGNPATNHYYVVRAVCDNGFESPNSNREGEFDFAMTPGVGPSNLRYNLIGYNLDVNGVSDALDLSAYAAPGVYMILKYEAPTQSFDWVIPGPPAFGLPPFPVDVGDPIMLYSTHLAATVLSIVGGVPDPGDVQFTLTAPGPGDPCKFNFITVPLDRDDLTSADELAADIGGVYQVLQYDASTQSFVWRIPPDPPSSGFGTNFSVRRGYPYVLCVNSDAPAVWP